MSTYDTAWYEVVEAEHDFQNPIGAEHVHDLGVALELTPGSTVLDVGAGRCGPAIALAQEFGCRVTCVEASPVFARAGRDRIRAAGLGSLVELVQTDAATYRLGWYDAVICLGAAFIFGGLRETLLRLATAAPLVAVGEPWTDLPETLDEIAAAGVDVEEQIESTEQDWRRYEAQRLIALERWLEHHPERAHDARVREGRAVTKRIEEDRQWSIFVCRV